MLESGPVGAGIVPVSQPAVWGLSLPEPLKDRKKR